VSRGRTRKGRGRAKRALLTLPPARPLLRGVDHGPEIRLSASDVGGDGERWIEPFLHANGPHLHRLGIRTRVETGGGVALALSPGPRIGAVPLLSPATRRVAAGLVVAPRFRWDSLGAVLGEVGFATEPALGGAPLVPGSAREVPPWMLASPVLRRLEGLLAHRKRGFVERHEHRSSPRGRVDWGEWARRDVPAGRWARLPCHFPEPDDDPDLMACVRWTLHRLDEELSPHGHAGPARLLRARVGDLLARVGPGADRRPAPGGPGGSGWLADALQAMSWVSEERGLGGARTLDGLCWDLAVDELWECWVDAFIAALAPRCGLVHVARGQTRRGLNWLTPLASMRALIPDTGLRGAGRMVWVDAKYKAHLRLLGRRGWMGLSDDVRAAHRADLHQALAYANLDSVDRVDTMLVYPVSSAAASRPPAVATVAAGQRRVRLHLAALPYGLRSREQREATLADWRTLLTA